MIKKNPVFYSFLGICTSLAVTTTLEKSYVMGILVLIILIFSNLFISLLKKVINEKNKTAISLFIIGIFVTLIYTLVKVYIPELFNSFSIYLPLLIINSFLLIQGNSALDNSILNNLRKGLIMGTGYMIALSLIGFIREFMGNNSITIIDNLSNILGFKLIITDILPKTIIFPNNLFIMPAGAFLTVGLLLGLFNYLRGKYESN